MKTTVVVEPYILGVVETRRQMRGMQGLLVRDGLVEEEELAPFFLLIFTSASSL
jgi:hypothetical protein